VVQHATARPRRRPSYNTETTISNSGLYSLDSIQRVSVAHKTWPDERLHLRVSFRVPFNLRGRFQDKRTSILYVSPFIFK